MSSTVLTIRTADGQQQRWFVNAAEARRSLLRQVRKNSWSINGNGKQGVLKSGGVIAGSYCIRPCIM